MADILSDSALRLKRIFGNRGLLFGAFVATAAGSALTALPLFRQPGFELASAMALIVTLACGPAAIAVARRERREAKGARPHLVSPFLASASFGLLALGIPFLVAVVRTTATTSCSPWTGALFYLLIPVPSAFVAAAAGLCVGFIFKRAIVSYLAYGAVVVASVVVSVWPLWFGPQVFALNHFFGYFPGPLYDEALAVDARLIVYRATSLAWALLALSGLASLHMWRLHKRLEGGSALAALVAIGALVAVHVFRFDLNLEASDDSVARALGGETRTDHFAIHFPRSKAPEEIARMERDLEANWATVHAFLGAAPDAPIHAYFHRSAKEKRRLVGAASTSFAKPWRLEFHLQDAPFPHPVARHELVHVMASVFGSPVFRVSARNVIAIDMGLVEGLAVAADNPVGELTLDEQVAAMRSLGLAPDIREIVGMRGFWRQAPSRAYTVAGSFLRHVAERYGAPAVRALYPAGDFLGATGKSLDTLASEWEAAVDAVPLDARALRVAELMFRRGSLFDRPCAREVAYLADRAESLADRDPMRAVELFDRCAALEPRNGAWVYAATRTIQANRLPIDAELRWWRLAEDPESPEALRALARASLGDLAWFQGDLDAARELFLDAEQAGRDRAFQRQLALKLLALRSPTLEEPARRFFERPGELPELLALESIARAGERWEESVLSNRDEALHPAACAIANYLIGRQLLSRDAPRAALGYLREARLCNPAFFELAAPEPGSGEREIRLETWRMTIRAAFLAGDDGAFEDAATRLEREGETPDRRLVEDWRARAAFERATFGGLIRSER